MLNFLTVTAYRINKPIMEIWKPSIEQEKFLSTPRTIKINGVSKMVIKFAAITTPWGITHFYNLRKIEKLEDCFCFTTVNGRRYYYDLTEVAKIEIESEEPSNEIC